MKKLMLVILTLYSLAVNANNTKAKGKHDIQIVRNIKIEGYKAFDYALWMHPLQLNLDLQNYLVKPVLDDMKKYIPKGSVAIDIGAHTGDTSVAYSLVVGENGKVIAFEPNPAAFEVLKVNANLNKNIIPVNFAITETEGKFTFHYTDIGLCNGGFGEMLQYGPSAVGTVPLEVKGVNLEKWLNANYKDLIDKIKFIKIDTEGYDRYILKSIKNLINLNKPIIQCEVYTGLAKEERIDLYNTIKSLNYNCFFNNLKLDLEKFINIQHADIMCYPN